MAKCVTTPGNQKEVARRLRCRDNAGACRRKAQFHRTVAAVYVAAIVVTAALYRRGGTTAGTVFATLVGASWSG
jgi:hypothetical protein